MASLIDLVNLLEAEVSGISFYPLEYPINSPVNSCTVDWNGTGTSVAGNFPLSVQIKIRDEHPAKAELTCASIKQVLDKRTNYYLDELQVVLSECQNPLPLFMGKDGNGDYLYSMNFRFVINEGV